MLGVGWHLLIAVAFAFGLVRKPDYSILPAAFHSENTFSALRLSAACFGRFWIQQFWLIVDPTSKRTYIAPPCIARLFGLPWPRADPESGFSGATRASALATRSLWSAAGIKAISATHSIIALPDSLFFTGPWDATGHAVRSLRNESHRGATFAESSYSPPDPQSCRRALSKRGIKYNFFRIRGDVGEQVDGRDIIEQAHNPDDASGTKLPFYSARAVDRRT